MTTADLSSVAAKAALRRRIRDARQARGEADRVHAAGSIAARAIPLLAGSTIVASYLSMDSEPGTAELIDLLRQRDIRVLLPRVEDQELVWVEFVDGTAFTRSMLGMQEPTGRGIVGALADCNAIVLPALAVASDGSRLGQGGGFYDRALQDVPMHADGGPLRIGLLFDDEIFAELPTEAHDCRVDHAITPERTLSF
ncbi:MAG: 5-formyltetrahydrofolate cyclo-ligase [Actinomycetes bacterium]